VFTVGYVARMLGESEELIEAIAIDMDPEDGRRFIIEHPGENAPVTTAFTEFGIQSLIEFIPDYKPNFLVTQKSAASTE